MLLVGMSKSIAAEAASYDAAASAGLLLSQERPSGPMPFAMITKEHRG
jgi:hypothetical protein